MESSNKPVLILGIGNILLGDEGIGVRVIEAMANLRLPEHVEILDGGTSGADLVDQIAHRQKLIVVDAMQADSPPATVLRLSGQDLLERNTGSVSLHEFGLAETLLMARSLGCEPAEVVIYGVQPKEVSPGLELSPEVSAVVRRLIDVLLDESRKLSEGAAGTKAR